MSLWQNHLSINPRIPQPADSSDVSCELVSEPVDGIKGSFFMHVTLTLNVRIAATVTLHFRTPWLKTTIVEHHEKANMVATAHYCMEILCKQFGITDKMNIQIHETNWTRRIDSFCSIMDCAHVVLYEHMSDCRHTGLLYQVDILLTM